MGNNIPLRRRLFNDQRFHSSVIQAIRAQDKKSVSKLIRKKKVNLEIILAVAIGLRTDIDIVQMLIDAGAKVNPIHSKGIQAHLVANIDHSSICEVNFPEIFTPLQMALAENRIDIARMLIDHGADVNMLIVPDSAPQTLLHAAVQPKTYDNGTDTLTQTIVEDSLQFIQLFIEAGINYKQVDYMGDTVLHVCALVNHLEAARYLMEHIPWFSTQAHNVYCKEGFAPIHIAIRRLHHEFVHLLLTNGCDPSIRTKDGEGLLCFAVNCNSTTEIIQQVLAAEVDVNQRNLKSRLSALHLSVQQPRLEIATLLLEHPDIDVNIVNNGGFTPLHIAAKKGNIDMVKLLLLKGAKTDAVDHKNKRTPLHEGCINGNLEILATLLENHRLVHGDESLLSYINVQDVANKTAIIVAVTNGKSDAVKVLLESGADVNIVDKFGNSPLYLAVTMGRNTVAQQLISAGANVDQYNNEGRGPLHSALTYPKCDLFMVSELLQANCDPINLDDFLEFLLHTGILKRDYCDEKDLQLIIDIKTRVKRLKNLCRCVIVKSLPDQKFSKEYKAAVESLHLPTFLVNYLKVKLL